MNKLSKITATLVVTAVLAFTLNACSSDDNEKSPYLSCSEAEDIMFSCSMQIMLVNPELLACIMACDDDDDACMEACISPSNVSEILQCSVEQGLCGEGNSYNKTCAEHYDECDLFGE